MMDYSRSNRPWDLIFAASVLLIPFISWGRPPWLSGVFVLLTVVLFIWQLVDERKAGGIHLPASPLWAPLSLILFLSLYHLLRTPVPYASLSFIVQLTVAALFFYLTLRCSPVPGFPIAVTVWTATIIPWITWQYLSGHRPPSGPFLNPNYTGTVLLCCLALSLGSLLRSQGRSREAALTLGTAAACTGGLMMIGSRSAGLGMILLWSVFFTLKRGYARWLAVLAIIVILLVPNTLRYRVTEGYRVDPHAFSRIQIWKAALAMGRDHPLTGVGPNLFYDRSPPYAFPTEALPVKYGRIARKPHSEYLRAWAEGGIIGALAAGLLLWACLRLVWRAWLKGREGPALAVVVICYQALFHDVTEVLSLTVLMVWLLGRLSPREEGNSLSVSGFRSRVVPALAGFAAVCLALWVNLDLASRAFWLKGQTVMPVDHSQARVFFNQALTLNPLHPGAARELAQVMRLGAKQEPGSVSLERVQAAVARARRLNRADSVPLRVEAALHIDEARYGGPGTGKALLAAQEELLRALRLEPHNALIMLSLSEIAWDLGQPARALNILQRALDTEPNYLEAHRMKISWLRDFDPSKVLEAQSGLSLALKRAAAYKPRSDYEAIILR